MSDPLKSYGELQKAFSSDVRSDKNQKLIGEVFKSSLEFLSQTSRKELKSLVPGKSYFAFSKGRKISRAINAGLYITHFGEWERFLNALDAPPITLDPERITKIIYSVAVSFFSFIDLTKEGDQKTPGTYFEYLIGHLFARHLG